MSNILGIKPKHIDSSTATEGQVLAADASNGTNFVTLNTEQNTIVQYNASGGETSKVIPIQDGTVINSVEFNLSEISAVDYQTYAPGGSTITDRADIAALNALSGDYNLIITITPVVTDIVSLIVKYTPPA